MTLEHMQANTLDSLSIYVRAGSQTLNIGNIFRASVSFPLLSLWSFKIIYKYLVNPLRKILHISPEMVLVFESRGSSSFTTMWHSFFCDTELFCRYLTH